MNEVRKAFILQNPRWLRRGFAEFDRFISAAKQPIVLLEGSRNAPAEILSKMEQLAAHLMRDLSFPLGHRNYSGKRQKATTALFYLDPNKPNGGGTGHTLRLCEAQRVPYFLAEDWLSWRQRE